MTRGHKVLVSVLVVILLGELYLLHLAKELKDRCKSKCLPGVTSVEITDFSADKCQCQYLIVGPEFVAPPKTEGPNE